jgi:hypothetical protein
MTVDCIPRCKRGIDLALKDENQDKMVGKGFGSCTLVAHVLIHTPKTANAAQRKPKQRKMLSLGLLKEC